MSNKSMEPIMTHEECDADMRREVEGDFMVLLSFSSDGVAFNYDMALGDAAAQLLAEHVIGKALDAFTADPWKALADAGFNRADAERRMREAEQRIKSDPFYVQSRHEMDVWHLEKLRDDREYARACFADPNFSARHEERLRTDADYAALYQQIFGMTVESEPARKTKHAKDSGRTEG